MINWAKTIETGAIRKNLSCEIDQHHVGDGDGPGQRAQDRQCADDQGEALVDQLRVRREPVELKERGIDLPEWVQEITGVGLEPVRQSEAQPDRQREQCNQGMLEPGPHTRWHR